MTTGTIALYDRDGREKIFTLAEHARMVGNGQVGPGREWSSVAPPPASWERVVPRYKVSRHRPAGAAGPLSHSNRRSRPVATDVWQYGERASWPAKLSRPRRGRTRRLSRSTTARNACSSFSTRG